MLNWQIFTQAGVGHVSSQVGQLFLRFFQLFHILGIVVYDKLLHLLSVLDATGPFIFELALEGINFTSLLTDLLVSRVLRWLLTSDVACLK